MDNVAAVFFEAWGENPVTRLVHHASCSSLRLHSKLDATDSRLGKVRDNWLRRSADERQAPARDVAERMLAYQRECESRATVQVTYVTRENARSFNTTPRITPPGDGF